MSDSQMDLPHPDRKRKSFQSEAHDGPLTEMVREHKGSKTLKKESISMPFGHHSARCWGPRSAGVSGSESFYHRSACVL